MTTHRHQLRTVHTSPPRRYFTSKEAQAYLGYATLHAFTCAYPRLGIPTYRLGRSLRFLQEDLDAAFSRVEAVEPRPRRQRA